MSLLKKIFGLQSSKRSASTARERLQIVLSHQRSDEATPDFLPNLRTELLNVICKYVKIDPDQINVELQQVGNRSVLELNIALPNLATETTS